jgi:hypothetical protein
MENDPFAKAKDLHPEWSPLYNRVLRAAGLDDNLNRQFKPLRDKMDTYLDTYNDQHFLAIIKDVEIILPTPEQPQRFGVPIIDK